LFLRFGGLSDKLNTDWAVFSETQQAVELLQQFSGLFLRWLSFICVWPSPYLFLPCGLVWHARCLRSPWYARLFLPRQRHGNTSPVSIISGDGYSVFKVQYQADNQTFRW